MYDVYHELPNNLRIRSLGDEEISKCLELMMTAQKATQKGNFDGSYRKVQENSSKPFHIKIYFVDLYLIFCLRLLEETLFQTQPRHLGIYISCRF